MSPNLDEYKAKRDFNRTREPEGGRAVARRRSARLRFVVQKHEASHLHYDFRLEMDGVLKSWAVPKAIPTDKGERRLAMEVENHPVEYGRFEGVIPAGNYGAGTVQLWDHGKYEVPDGSPSDALRKGKLSFVLHGKKLKGHWTLVRTRGENGPEHSWLLIKTGESLPSLSSEDLDRSVLSGKTMAEISRHPKHWRSSGSTPGTFKREIQELVARRR
jgi:bifunctional non-homologous end joining protein LigD